MFAVTLSSIVFQVVQSVKTGRLIILQFYITYFCHLIRFFHSYLSTTSIRENMGGLNRLINISTDTCTINYHKKREKQNTPFLSRNLYINKFY